MKTTINESSKTIEIWIESSEKENYKESEEYKQTISAYKSEYSIIVFIGGSKPLLQTITDLLKEQSKSPAAAG